MDVSDVWDCAVVGGGAAGLSAALVLSRARRRVLLVDAGGQSNLASLRIGGVLGADGMAPAEFYARSRAAISRYGYVEFVSDTVISGRNGESDFTLTTEGGEEFRGRTVLLAAGMEYRYPDVIGLTERWGRSVFHCPFCHGWEVQDQVLGVLDSSPLGPHRALLLRAWSDDVTLFTNGPAGFAPEEFAQLTAAGIAVDDRPVTAVQGPTTDSLESIVFADGAEHPITSLLVQTRLHQRSGLTHTLGRPELVSNPMAVDGVKVDERSASTVPGLFAAGDVTGTMPTVLGAMAAGGAAGSAIVGELTKPPVGQ
ncbi:hypothetical protein B8W67_17200 [Mycolicibacillus koreensis]|uniref:FAD/NAD(P)-binding domain-containing protein n=1 Tax=Mycolicibacillus koreensis TaxID=1069220 RepID=A0AA91PCY1_9MYCO|nr:hypothetical protein B8W67_17200 [Mycolicibacillus koreensis]